MAKQVSNKFWLAESTKGRHKMFETAEHLREACIEYFNWVDDNPLTEYKAHPMMGVIEYSETPRMRAMTHEGMARFIGATRMSWSRWRNGELGEDYAEVVEWAESIVRDQKFTAAAADLMNSVIISRDLGLADKSSVNHSSLDGTMSPNVIRLVAVDSDRSDDQPSQETLPGI